MFEFISCPKVNVCFKIKGILPNGYCDICSRYVRVENACADIIKISDSASFDIKGFENLPLQNNTIFKAKEALKNALIASNDKRARFLDKFCIHVEKYIPACAGLGGGSSNAGVYLRAMNEILDLGFSTSALSAIAQKIGADVAFFVHDVMSANARGFGENIEPYMEESLAFEILTPPIECSTHAVYTHFKNQARFSCEDSCEALLRMDSKDILQHDAVFLNDLYTSAIALYPQLLEYARDGYYFSGSGSSFFVLNRVCDE